MICFDLPKVRLCNLKPVNIHFRLITSVHYVTLPLWLIYLQFESWGRGAFLWSFSVLPYCLLGQVFISSLIGKDNSKAAAHVAVRPPVLDTVKQYNSNKIRL